MPWEKRPPIGAACKVARIRLDKKLSRPFRPHRVVIPQPRASAFGLSPGLCSPGPLGRPYQRFLAGISTRVGVESAAHSAYGHGYNVVLVTDAMTDRNPDAHRHSVETVFPRMGEITTTEEVLARLEGQG